MIEVFDTVAARIALACRKLGCPGCGQPMRPWGHARERVVRRLADTVTVRPDRARCTDCGITHVVLDAGLLPRRSCTADMAGQALVAAALGHGHRRIAADLAVPAGTVRGWIRGARWAATQLRVTGIRFVVALDQDALPASTRPDELGCALEHLAAAAVVTGDRYRLQHTSMWARIKPAVPFPAPACPLAGITARITLPGRHRAHRARHLPHDTPQLPGSLSAS